jgi:NitT/TauT family transport system permease protein
VLILQMEAQMDTGGSFSVFIVLSVIGIVLTAILRRIQQRVLRWMPQDPTQQRTINV